MKRVAAGWGLLAGAALATLAHVAYWYWPRERGATPVAPETRSLLSDPTFDGALWVPYPHQNLAVLERRVGDVRAWSKLLAGGEGARGEGLPSFGPFAVPPAYEMTVAWRRSDGRNAVAMRVFPSVGLIARLAGRLAGNPWLTGGDVPLGRGGRGRVSWRSGVWRLDVGSYGTPPELPRRVDGESAPRALLRLGHPLGPLPGGLYRLVRGDAGTELRLGRFAHDLPPTPLAQLEPPAGWRVEMAGRRRLSALLCWDRDGAVPPFPAAAVLGAGNASVPHLPGEELLRLAGRKPLVRSGDAFEARALERRDLELMLQAVPELAAAVSGNRHLRTWIGIDPERLGATARRVAKQFRGLPVGALLGFDPGELAERLAPLEGCGTSILAVESEPDAVLWRLCPPRPPEAAVN